MKEIVDVNTGEVKVSRKKITFSSIAIGSCIVIAAYDSAKRTGAMAHIMLPGSAPEKTSERTKYAADAIDVMVKRMTLRGTKRCDIEACLVGGGNVLKEKDDTICKANIESTTQLLKEKNIPVRAAVLGGTERKGVFLDIEKGSIFYTKGDEREKPLWKSKKTH